jgi:uncharacterized protein (TIGR02300 family)
LTPDTDGEGQCVALAKAALKWQAPALPDFQEDIRVAKAELGEKQTCPGCTKKFYDLRRRPAHCPHCGTEFDPDDDSIKLKRVRTRPVNYETDYEDEEEDAPAKVVAEGADDASEEETEEVTPELGADPTEEADLIMDDEDDTIPNNPDALPAGFSETDEDEDLAAEDSDDVPILDDEDEFPDADLEEMSEDDEEPK